MCLPSDSPATNLKLRPPDLEEYPFHIVEPKYCQLPDGPIADKARTEIITKCVRAA